MSSQRREDRGPNDELEFQTSSDPSELVTVETPIRTDEGFSAPNATGRTMMQSGLELPIADKILRTLEYEAMFSRYLSIDHAYRDTFEWLLEDGVSPTDTSASSQIKLNSSGLRVQLPPVRAFTSTGNSSTSKKRLRLSDYKNRRQEGKSGKLTSGTPLSSSIHSQQYTTENNYRNNRQIVSESYSQGWSQNLGQALSNGLSTTQNFPSTIGIPSAKRCELPQWFKSGNRIVWMTGKPGSGKSTAMKFILNHQRTRDLLAVWASPESCVVAYHFFSLSGTNLQRSSLGFLRSILYQLFSQAPSLIHFAAPHRWDAKDKDAYVGWTIDELMQALLLITSHEDLPHHICIFVDGIDEMDGDLVGFTQLLHEIARSSKVKLYVSCRPLNVFQDAFGAELRFDIQDFTKEDLKRFVEGRVEEASRRVHGQSLLQLTQEVVSRAEGVFLYASLASHLLVQGILSGYSLRELSRMLNLQPTILGEMYRSMLHSIEPVYLREASRFLKVAAFADVPQRLMLYELINDDTDWTSASWPWTQKEFTSMQEQLQRRITSRCRGLLEVQTDASSDGSYQLPPKVVLVHSTLTDFLLQPENQEFLDRNDPAFDIGEALSQAYPRLLESLPVDDPITRPLLPVTHVFLESVFHIIEHHAGGGNTKFVPEVSHLTESFAYVIWRFQTRGGEFDWQSFLENILVQDFGNRDPDLIQIEKLSSEVARFLTLLTLESLSPEIMKSPSPQFLVGAEKSRVEHSSEDKHVSTPSVNQDTPTSGLVDFCVEGSEVSSETDTRPGYAESLFSTGTANSSLTAPSSHGYGQSAREMLVEFMLEDADLRPLFIAAANDPNIGVKRLQRNLQRILVAYSRDLLRSAGNDLQQDTSKLVFTSALYVSQHICKHVENVPAGATLSLSSMEISQQRSLNEQRVRQYLESLQNSGTSAALFENDPDLEFASELDQDGRDGVADEQYSEDKITGSLIQVKRFLKEGSPFENLRRGLRSFAIPQTQSGDNQMSTSPDNPTEVTEMKLIASLDDQVEKVAEIEYPDLPSMVDKIFDLLAFSHQEPAVPQGARRIRWQCSCGVHLFDDFWELRRGALDQLEAHLRQLASTSTASQVHHAMSLIGKCLAVFVAPIKTLFSKGNSTSSIGTTSLPLHNTGTQSAQRSDSSQDQYLLLCIDKGEVETKLFHHVVAGIDTDRKLFQALRKYVHKQRDMRNWFTLKSINRLSLSKFVVDESDFTENVPHNCQEKCVCLPPEHLVGDDRDYQCHPAPKEDPGYAPAIGPRCLTHYFRCPNGPKANQRSVLYQLPKRNRGKLRATDLKAVEGWGIHFEVGWHWKTIYVVVVVVLTLFSLVFGIVWSITKGDISGAFAISSFWLNLGSLLVGYLALRSK